MTGVGAEGDESMLPLAPIDEASEEIRNLLSYGQIARMDDWSLINIKLEKRGPFLWERSPADLACVPPASLCSGLLSAMPLRRTQSTSLAERNPRLLAEHLLGYEEHVGGSFGQTAHEIRVPFAAEGNVDAYVVSLGNQLALQIAAHSKKHLKFEMAGGDAVLSDKGFCGGDHASSWVARPW